jgi:hypothetical protein
MPTKAQLHTPGKLTGGSSFFERERIKDETFPTSNYNQHIIERREIEEVDDDDDIIIFM